MTRLGSLLALFLAALPGAVVAQAAAPAASSPSIAAQMHSPMPANVAQLDAALAAKDYATLNRLHDDIRQFNDMILFMNWEQVRGFDGAGGVHLSLLYMTDLWTVASAMEKAGPSMVQQGAEMKQSAVFMGLYSYQLIVLDGVKCSDATAAGHRLDQLLGRTEIWAYIPQIPEEMRAKMVSAVLILETHTAPVRTDDNALCTGGMTQMIAGLAAAAKSGQAPKPVPNRPGTVGQSYEVPAPPDFQAGFVSPDVWRSQQTKLREAMPARLAGMMTVAPPPKP